MEKSAIDPGRLDIGAPAAERDVNALGGARVLRGANQGPCGELRFQYPGLLNVFEAFRSVGPYFEREDLELKCLEIATEMLLHDQASTWVTDRDPDELIEVLWRIGFLQASTGRNARTGRGGSFPGPYQVGNPNLRAVQHFRVHPVFWAHLALLERAKPPKPGGHDAVPRSAPAQDGRKR